MGRARSADSVDPDSGTTPDEYLAIMQADVSGDTLNRITAGMTGLTTEQLADGVRPSIAAPSAQGSWRPRRGSRG